MIYVSDSDSRELADRVSTLVMSIMSLDRYLHYAQEDYDLAGRGVVMPEMDWPGFAAYAATLAASTARTIFPHLTEGE